MKYIVILLISAIIFSCSTSKVVYWCGDHPCINKKERELYFKKTMVVETKNISKNKKNTSQLEKLMEEAKKEQKTILNDEKEKAKQARLEEKERIKEEKRLAKQARLEEKERIKEEKRLAKQARLEEKKRIKEEKQLLKKTQLEKKQYIKKEKSIVKKIEPDEKKITNKEQKVETVKTKKIVKLDNISEDLKIESGKFDAIVNKIVKRNSSRNYPDINDIPKE